MSESIHDNILSLRASAQGLLSEALDEISTPEPALAEMDPETRNLTASVNHSKQIALVMLQKNVELLENLFTIKVKRFGKA